jgi:hypothetical protein
MIIEVILLGDVFYRFSKAHLLPVLIATVPGNQGILLGTINRQVKISAMASSYLRHTFVILTPWGVHERLYEAIFSSLPPTIVFSLRCYIMVHLSQKS